MRKNKLNDPDFFWKNFRLGTELQISGTHIYNALYFLDKLEYLRHEEEIFEFLYNASVGIERIQKITLILLEHNEEVVQEVFEKSLITHNHLDLNKRIRKRKILNYGKIHLKFLNLITSFYKSYRYGRYTKSSVYHKNYDKHTLLEFINAELNLNYPSNTDYIVNDKRVRNFLGKIISKIVCELYEIIRERAFVIGTFTYEIRYESKAFKIFIAKDYNFDKENSVKREILISLLNQKGLNDDFTNHIKSIYPLPFKMYNSSYYIKFLFDSINHYGAVNEYVYFKEEKLVPSKRASEIDVIGEIQYLKDDYDNLFTDPEV
ncbi:MAG: hypothetical protein ACNS60_15830 [Candidatus Cyclobacteriaceae bacterium M2_1C_046]